MNIREILEGLQDKEDNPCWKGYHPIGTKKKRGKTVPNCVPVKEEYMSFEEGKLLAEALKAFLSGAELMEAEYHGRTVTLNKPFLTPGGPKKRSVYVKNKKGNVIKVNFGDPNMRIKKSSPKHRKSFRARHKCDTAKDKTTARYWSCRAW